MVLDVASYRTARTRAGSVVRVSCDGRRVSRPEPVEWLDPDDSDALLAAAFPLLRDALADGPGAEVEYLWGWGLPRFFVHRYAVGRFREGKRFDAEEASRFDDPERQAWYGEDARSFARAVAEALGGPAS